jgi:serine/threonine protein kinase
VIGQTLSHFKITAKLGEGGMGEVYRAEDTKLGREVAIKVLPETVARDPERLARFEREAKVLASLNHPHIAAIYEVGEAEGAADHPAVHFLVMELAEGDTLAERIHRGPIPAEDALPLALQVAEALEAAHGKGIIHRDLKPANVKVTPDGQVKVLDFGLAKALDPQDPETLQHPDLSASPTLTAQTTGPGILLGTVAYMSPEQARGKPVDKRADIWAYGVVLWEMLTGDHLFAGETVTDVLAGVVSREPAWSDLPDATPPVLRRLLRRCLQKDPARRLHDIADARLELEEIDLEPGQAPLPERPRRWLTLLPWALLTTSLAVILALLLIPDSQTAPEKRVIRFTLDLPEEHSLAVWWDGSPLAISPDGTQIVAALEGPDGRRLYRRSLDDPEFEPLEGTEGARHPFFSPDGRWLGFFAELQLKKILYPGGVPVTLTHLDTDPDHAGPRGAAWSENGTIVLPLSQESGLYRISEEGGEPAPVTQLDPQSEERSHRWPQFLPGGRFLLLTVEHETDLSFDEARIALLDLTTGERRTILGGATYPGYLSSEHLIYGHHGRLFTAPFDLAQRQVSGTPVNVFPSIWEHSPPERSASRFSGPEPR